MNEIQTSIHKKYFIPSSELNIPELSMEGWEVVSSKASAIYDDTAISTGSKNINDCITHGIEITLGHIA